MSEKESGNKQIISKDQSGEEILKEERQVEILAEKVTTKIKIDIATINIKKYYKASNYHIINSWRPHRLVTRVVRNQ